MTAVLPPRTAAPAAPTGPAAEVLVLELCARTADVSAAVLALVDAAASGQLSRVVAAAAAVQDEAAVLGGSLGPHARAGIVLDPGAIETPLRGRLGTAIYCADLHTAKEIRR